MVKPFPAYKGNEPYIFVSYAHEDDNRVYQEIQWLHQQGCNLWYDEGISPGSEWHTELAESIKNAGLFLYFVTPRSVKSDHCQREVHYATDHKIPLLVVHLEPTELPSGLGLSISSIQAIMCYQLSNEEYHAKLIKGTSEHIQRGVARGYESGSSIYRKTTNNKTTIWIAAVILAGLVVGGSAWMFWINPEPEPLTENDVTLPVNTIRPNWIAVLPFRTVSANEDESGLLAEGITGDLISALSGLAKFSVPSHGDVRVYVDSSMSSRQISTELGVRYLIEGRVQLSGEQTRIGVFLVDGVIGKTLWEETRSYQGLDQLDIQDEFTRFVNGALDVELLRFEGERVRDLPIQDMQVWDHWVRATTIWDDLSPETMAAAIREHRRALELEPDYVLSLGQLSTVINISTLMAESPDRDVARMEACQMANRAIALGQKSPFALFSSVAVLAALCGEAGKAVQIGRQMVLSHQDSGYNQTILGWALAYAGELEEGLQVLSEAEQDFPDNIYVKRYSPWFKAAIYTEQQAWDKALETSRTALNLRPTDVFAMMHLANEMGVLNRPDEARDVWNQLLLIFPKFSIENYEWWLKQGLITDERVEPFVRGLKLAGLESS